MKFFAANTPVERYEGPAAKRRKVSRQVSVPAGKDEVVEVERKGVVLAELEICLVR